MSRKMEKVISFFINLFTFWFFYNVYTRTQHEMTVEFARVERLKLASYSEFKAEFEKRNWTQLSRFTSLKSNDAFLHASIYMFGGIGFLMTTYGVIRAEKLIRKHLNKIQSKKPLIK